MNQNEKYAAISSVALADDLADYLVEVIRIIISNCYYLIVSVCILISFQISYLRPCYTRLLDQKFEIKIYGMNYQSK